MECDLFGNLPSEITANILSRLSIRGIAVSKCVCKPWLNLLVKCKVKTPPTLARLMWLKRNSIRCTTFEIDDEDEADDEKSHDLHYIPLTYFDIPQAYFVFMKVITANGLLLLYCYFDNNYSDDKCTPFYIYNLITREYIEVCCPEEVRPIPVLSYGIGLSKLSDQYKVVCVSEARGSGTRYHADTLGTGTWRRLEAGMASGFRFNNGGLILCNGNLHWKVLSDSTQTFCLMISGFDVETEWFRIFSLPPEEDGVPIGDLAVLSDSLCYTYVSCGELANWMMKEYQVEESWTIEYKLSTTGFDFGWDSQPCVDPIKLYEDGDVLMLLDGNRLIYYSNKTRTVQYVNMFNDANAKYYFNALIFTPSPFSLKNFEYENLISF